MDGRRRGHLDLERDRRALQLRVVPLARRVFRFLARKRPKADDVRAGRVIARIGTTGTVTGAHLHFEVRREGRAIDPLPLVSCIL